MSARRAAPRWISRRDGFTLFEALVAVALMGLILSILAVVTAQWVPHWRAGFERLQRAELTRLALDRIVSDLAAAEFIAPIGADGFIPRLILERHLRALANRPEGIDGPTPTGLEIIRFATIAKEGGLVRSRIPFTPETSASFSSDDFEFSDSSLLLRAPLKVSFGFAGPDRVWSDDWARDATLPAAVRRHRPQRKFGRGPGGFDSDERSHQRAGSRGGEGGYPLPRTSEARRTASQTAWRRNRRLERFYDAGPFLSLPTRNRRGLDSARSVASSSWPCCDSSRARRARLSLRAVRQQHRRRGAGLRRTAAGGRPDHRGRSN